ncbi:uncharacterized protein METZ01_LOCUS187769 [marine metagenome]|uniref:Uncharacterized protein n=1 Tax=marine metagenome TaxID=408172 RepID=A0A382D9H6_9ZZZZ
MDNIELDLCYFFKRIIVVERLA